MKSLKHVANILRSKGWLVSICVDREWRYKGGRQVRRPVYRVGVNPPNGRALDWEVRTCEFPWEGEDWLKDILSGVA